MADVSEFLLLGVVLGLVQGISPGPLVTLVISETLKFGKREGSKVAVSPLISDSTVAVLALVVLSNLAQNALIIGVISLLGAGYLIYLAWDNLKVKTSILEAGSAKKGALKRALVTNFLNPHVYVFWFSVGGPIILRSLTVNVSATALYLAGLFTFLIGSMASIAYVVYRSKAFIGSKYYVYLIRALGIVLILFALVLVSEGLTLLATI
jgi:threonine/homoserine/homoserine lactone efflux protein